MDRASVSRLSSSLFLGAIINYLTRFHFLHFSFTPKNRNANKASTERVSGPVGVHQKASFPPFNRRFTMVQPSRSVPKETSPSVSDSHVPFQMLA
mmetsp:Transcript_6483/g.11281  ORF Transcript_6483/g.11281 Transcript_6483/m.11281 type:complete len:95 (+) Transcript_6483:183-467(+)